VTTADARSTRKRRTYAPRVPARQRRAQLLDAALRLIVSGGHQAVTMDAVAEQIGVTKPVVYGQFPSRDELLAQLLRREQEQALQQLAGIVAADGSRPPGDQLAELLAGYLDAVRQTPDRWYCIVMPMPDMPAGFHAAREAARAVVLEWIRRLTARLLRDGPAGLDEEIVAHTVVTVFEMAARLVLTDPERFTPARFTDTLRAAFPD
jgi:AcrR family transcriptional regulator